MGDALGDLCTSTLYFLGGDIHSSVAVEDVDDGRIYHNYLQAPGGGTTSIENYSGTSVEIDSDADSDSLLFSISNGCVVDTGVSKYKAINYFDLYDNNGNYYYLDEIS